MPEFKVVRKLIYIIDAIDDIDAMSKVAEMTEDEADHDIINAEEM